MKKSLIILMLIALTACQSVAISTPCTCAQMLAQADCVRRIECQWDSTKKICVISSIPSQPNTRTFPTFTVLIYKLDFPSSRMSRNKQASINQKSCQKYKILQIN